jgi:hypothetical protein
VGFDNPSYPQNYPQKLSGKYYCLAPDVRGSLAERVNYGGFFRGWVNILTI